MRIESIKKQVRCLYNLGDEYLRKTLNKIFDNQFKISYEHNGQMKAMPLVLWWNIRHNIL
jgi:hypothetical protein